MAFFKRKDNMLSTIYLHVYLSSECARNFFYLFQKFGCSVDSRPQRTKANARSVLVVQGHTIPYRQFHRCRRRYDDLPGTSDSRQPTVCSGHQRILNVGNILFHSIITTYWTLRYCYTKHDR